MNNIEFVSPETHINLTNCDREPIHTPGFIQPFAYVVVIDLTGKITRFSQNFSDLIGKKEEEILGVHLINIDPLSTTIIHASNDFEPKITFRNKVFFVRNISLMYERIIELQPQEDTQNDLNIIKNFHQSIFSISNKKSLDEVIQTIPDLTKKLTGYDRVMVYKFDRDTHGAVVAEARNENLPSFLDLHYPATDIPVQARELYKNNLIRMIADVDYLPVSIVSQIDTDPLDMTMVHSRSISPMHIQYLKNMKVTATLTISLIINGQLWGLIACHHYSGPKYLDINLRQMCISFGSVASFAITAWKELNRRLLFFSHETLIEKFIADLSQTRTLHHSLSNYFESLIMAAGSTGLCFIENDTITRWGECPDAVDILKLKQWLQKKLSERHLYQTSHLLLDYEHAEAIKDKASGLIAVKLPPNFSNSSKDCFLLWFRPEIIKTIYWAGDPQKPVKKDSSGHVFSPRDSFERWKEVQKNRAEPWSDEALITVTRLNKYIVDFSVEDFKQISQKTIIKMAHLERLSSLGQLSTGIAHDFNNILLGVQGGAQIIEQTSNPEKIRSSVAKIKMFCQRGQLLVKGLLTHSRSDRKDYAISDAKIILRDLTAFVQTMNGRQIDFAIKNLKPNESMYFFGNANEILQCLLNLVNNSKDALKTDNGSIDITLDQDNDKKFILFIVKDNGIGISPDIIERIFDPFFSTKDVGKGTGLGLASVRYIVRSHGGDVFVESKINQGSTFIIRLPKYYNQEINTGLTVQEKTTETENKQITNQLNVLYVEDNDDIRETYIEIFSDHFGIVEAASGGKIALEMIANKKFDLIISDLRMPGMDGMTLYRKVRETNKKTPFLLATGELLNRHEILGDLQDPLFDVLAKPFVLEKLLALASQLTLAENIKA